MPENNIDIDALIEELEELDEISTADGVGPYDTPFAFTGKSKKNKDKRKKIAKQAGYMIAKKIKKMLQNKNKNFKKSIVRGRSQKGRG